MAKQDMESGFSPRIPSLDGLRAVSICMVVIGHCSGTMGDLGYQTRMVLSVVGAGRLGVSIFFVISGFLITTLLVREQLATGTISLKNFYIRRAFRIFPAFYAYWLFALVLTVIGYIPLSHAELVSAAVYVWNYVPRQVDTWFLGHTWSLSLEEQFYLVWPLVLRSFGIRLGTWIALTAVVVAPIIRVSCYFLFPATRPLIGMMLPTRADSLMIGALLALICISGDHLRTLKQLVGSWLIPVASLCFLIVDTMLTAHFNGAYTLPFGYSLQNFMIVLLIAHCVFYDRTVLGRTLNHALIAHIGLISYSLYLWQQLFLTTNNKTFTGAFPWNILCAFLAAELSYYLLEKPFLRWRKRFSKASESRSTAKENQSLEPKRVILATSASR